MDNCSHVYIHIVFLFNIWIGGVATMVHWQT